MYVMNNTTRRLTFNLNNFLEELNSCFYSEKPDLIHETVEKYKTFLSRANKNIRENSIKYVKNHTLYTDNVQVKSYIDYCHNTSFNK